MPNTHRNSYSIQCRTGTIARFDLPYYTALAVCRRRADGSVPVRNTAGRGG